MKKEELNMPEEVSSEPLSTGLSQESEAPEKESVEQPESEFPKMVLPKKKIKRLPVKTICYCAVLVALSVIANTFTVYMSFAGSNALAFTYTVCFLAGAFFGPFAGFIVGACGDLVGWLINPAGGSFNPLLTLTSGLLGLIPGVVFMVRNKLFSAKKGSSIKFLPLWTILSFVLVWIVCTNVNTVVMYYFYIAGFSKKYTSFWPYYVYRIPFQTLFWSINLVLSVALVIPLKKILKL